MCKSDPKILQGVKAPGQLPGLLLLNEFAGSGSKSPRCETAGPLNAKWPEDLRTGALCEVGESTTGSSLWTRSKRDALKRFHLAKAAASEANCDLELD
mmetsp:Transcript_20079/g.32494  ORF Transcript_20079/g.32494 Transcript_20079/m.32494 type:complete len:98 (-) Transcript_20079:2021-2314(-)